MGSFSQGGSFSKAGGVTFRLLHQFTQVASVMAQPVVRELYSVLARMREAARARMSEWAAYQVVQDYAAVCFWAIRKLEYGFIAETFAELEAKAGRPLSVLDVGCGVVPLGNWCSRRGHQVTALDNSYADIAFLVRNKANNYYESNVSYLSARCEMLPFASESFDVVTSISVLEHIPPGNDLAALWEMARVLKPGGHLLMTFDVAPPHVAQEGGLPGPGSLRRFAEPFSSAAVQRLVKEIERFLIVPPLDELAELDALTWEDVDAFWCAAQAHDERAEAVRQYLAMGAVLQRRAVPVLYFASDLVAACLEGQAALEERLTFYQLECDKRLKVIEELKTVARERARLIDYLERQIKESKHDEAVRGRIQWIKAWAQAELARFRPKLGVLYQHPPKPLEVPKWYTSQRHSPQGLPTISIVTPSLNQAAFLERTIRSVLDQSYPNLEYIVQDGGSSDWTEVVLKRYAPFLAYVESARDKGQANAINLGFSRATGEILAYLNADDLLLPGALHYIGRFFAMHPDVDVVYGHRVLIDENDQEIGRWALPPHDNEVLLWGDYVPQETLFWRRRIWEKVGGHIDESFRFAMDWDLLLRFRDAGARFFRLPRFLGAFRVHPHQKTSAEIAELGAQEMNRLRERCHGRSVSDAEINRHVRPYLVKHVLCHKLYRLGVFRY